MASNNQGEEEANTAITPPVPFQDGSSFENAIEVTSEDENEDDRKPAASETTSAASDQGVDDKAVLAAAAVASLDSVNEEPMNKKPRLNPGGDGNGDDDDELVTMVVA